MLSSVKSTVIFSFQIFAMVHLSNWNEFATFEECLDINGSPIPPKKLAEESVGLSQPCTILLAFRDILSIWSNHVLTIHVIGAHDSYEVSHLKSYGSVFAKLLPLCEVNVLVSGIEVSPIETHLIGKSVTAAVAQGPYDKVFDLQQLPPDALVFFHPGFHADLATWTPAIKKALSTNCHLLITAYTRKELESDCCILQNLGAHIVTPPRKNAFRSLIPIDDPFEENRCFFDNHWFMVVKSV